MSKSSTMSQKESRYVQVPSEYECPITMMTMANPVFTADGQTYEKDAIARWLLLNKTSPLTGVILPHLRLVPNFALRKAIESWKLSSHVVVPIEAVAAAVKVAVADEVAKAMSRLENTKHAEMKNNIPLRLNALENFIHGVTKCSLPVVLRISNLEAQIGIEKPVANLVQIGIDNSVANFVMRLTVMENIIWNK